MRFDLVFLLLLAFEAEHCASVPGAYVVMQAACGQMTVLMRLPDLSDTRANNLAFVAGPVGIVVV